MDISKFSINSCCGRSSIIYKTEQPITISIISQLVSNGFNEQSHFTKAGILYVDNKEFIITGPIGSNKLQVKCKIANCEQNINIIEDLFKKII